MSDLDQWREWVKAADSRQQPTFPRVQDRELFPIRISTELPANPVGQDIAFRCFGHDSHFYHVKADKDGRAIRATEWIATNLANQLGLSVAECAILEDRNGETFFGSREPTSIADEMRCERFLRSPQPLDELRRPNPWLAQYFARLWAFDLFVDNPDRNLRNFILENGGRLRAIDFASARFFQRPETKFPIATDNTSVVGRFIRETHGTQLESAFELLDWIAAMAPSTVASIVKAMPEGWLTVGQMGEVVEVWSDDRCKNRVRSIKALIEHEW